MSYNRKFTHSINGESVDFDVTYDPETHFFTVLESGLMDSYLLKFDMATRTWSMEGDIASKIAADDLALLVQNQFGRSV